jgi:hypothetical protein
MYFRRPATKRSYNEAQGTDLLGKVRCRLFRQFIEGTSPSRLIGQLGAGQTVNCPDGPSPRGTQIGDGRALDL